MTLSEPADTEISPLFRVEPVTGGAELSTKDVDPRWIEEYSGESPDPERPLSQLEGLYFWMSVPAGQTSVDVSLPTLKDTATEPEESVRFRQADDSGEPQPDGAVISGTVLDAS